jgi:HAE1 family hydrophobic/amphiphilic exporter-1
LITAESDLLRFEDRLKVLLWIDLAGANISASDKPKEAPVALDESKIIENALATRLEIQGLAKELEQRQLELKFADNQTRPRLDVAAQYGVTGMSGLPSTACIDPTSIICEPVGNSITDSIFAGRTSPKDALNSLLTLHPFDTWSVELKLQIPLRNRTADARKSEANLQLLDTTARLRAVRDQITMEVRDAIRETQTSRKRIDASRETIKFVEDQLDGSRKRLQAGLASTYDVLQVLGQLDKARTSELKAIMDYNVAQSKVGLAEASNLSTYDVEVKKLPRFGFRQTTTQR